MDAVNEAVGKGIKIYTIGLGSTAGVPIPIYDNKGEMIGFKKDNAGNTVLTKLNEESLKQIAAAGHGASHRTGA